MPWLLVLLLLLLLLEVLLLLELLLLVLLLLVLLLLELLLLLLLLPPSPLSAGLWAISRTPTLEMVAALAGVAVMSPYTAIGEAMATVRKATRSQ